MRILGTGSAVPQKVVTNDDLSAFLDTSDEWISTRTGILERRVIGSEKLEDIAAQAAKNALEMANVGSDIDYIICSNVISPYVTPGLGCIVQGLLGLDCPSIDINGACAGFVYALQLANGLLATGAKNVLIISAEQNSSLVDWTDRATCVLLGDAAGAVVVTAGGEDALFQMSSHPNEKMLFAKNDTGNCPYCEKGEKQFMYMNGQEVYKFAVMASIADIKTLLERKGLDDGDIGHYLLHQANLRIIESARGRLKAPKEKFPTNIERYGNSSSASIPLLLDELNRNGELKDGEWIMMSAFGAGLVTGACLLRWNKCKC